MHDPRLASLAELMLDHSMRLEKGEFFSIAADLSAKPLVMSILKAARKRGVLARVDLTDNEISRHLLELYDPADGGQTAAFLEDKTAVNLRLFEKLAGEIVIRAYSNDAELSQIDPAVQQLVASQARPFKDLLINQRRWVLFEYPTPARAQRAGLSYESYFDYVLAASTLDYAQMARQAAPLVKLMEQTDLVTLKGPGTDLSFSIKNIPAVPCCGEYNLPDGECFTAPVLDSANGYISFNTPSLYWGTMFTDVKLEFTNGVISRAEAGANSQKLNEILATDEGARRLGEFALGFNSKIRQPALNTLFDEKIAGSFHLTPGSCYADADNGNQSAIHWDLVSIQRPEFGGGEIYFDNRLVRKDGDFVLDELLALNS